MGVSGLWTLLEPVGKRVNIKSLAGKTLAIGVCPSQYPRLLPSTDVDVNLWVCKVLPGVCIVSLPAHVLETGCTCTSNSALATLQTLLYGSISSSTPCEMMMETSSRMAICWASSAGSAGSCSTASGLCLCLMVPRLLSAHDHSCPKAAKGAASR